MIKAVFVKKHFLYVVYLVCGLFLIGLCTFVGITDAQATVNDLWFGIVFGTFFCVAGIVGFLHNFKAYLHVDENGYIKGRYHYFGKIDCSLSDVVFALGKINALIIRLKDGKTHTIMGIENSWPIASVIRRQMPFEVKEPAETLLEKLNAWRSSKKKGVICLCCTMALMFITVLVTVVLTGGRDMHEFCQTDWIVFTVMGVIELAAVIVTFVLAAKTGKLTFPIEELQYTLHRTIVETQRLLPGCPIAVYADEEFTERVTVFGYPHQNAVYYSVEELAFEHRLKKAHISQYGLKEAWTSDIYESIEELPIYLEGLIDITKKVL